MLLALYITKGASQDVLLGLQEETSVLSFTTTCPEMIAISCLSINCSAGSIVIADSVHNGR